MELALSGLVSGFDWRSIVDQLADVERAPQRRLLSEQAELGQKSALYNSLTTELSVLEGRVETLTDDGFFDQRLASVGDETIFSASAAAGASLGAFEINVTQLASASRWDGAANIGGALNATSDVSGLTLSDANFGIELTAGSFAVNGNMVDVSLTDSLQDVFDAISTATGGAVTGSYDSATDKITLSSASEIVLSSANDSSNFLLAARLYNNGTGSVSSSESLGAVQASVALDSANFGTAVSDGGAGAGEFKINGVSISFDAAADSLNNVLDRINSSEAGVLASYDFVNDRVTLTNKSTGDLGFALEDVTGNFLAAAGVSGGTLDRGENMLYTVNGGGTRASASNTVAGGESGVTGLTFTALQKGTSTISIDQNVAAIRSGIDGLIEQFNKVQSFIETNAGSSTDASGDVSAGPLQGETEVEEIAANLREIAVSQVAALSGTVKRLSDIGIDTSGFDNNLTVGDSEALDDALLNDLEKVKTLFLDETDGVAVRIAALVDRQVDDEGIIPTKIDLLTDQSASIDDQIEQMERLVQSNREAMIQSFIAMEQAQANTNQQLQYLTQQLGGA